MNISPLTIYFWGIADNLSNVSSGLIPVGIVGAIVCIFATAAVHDLMGKGDEGKAWQKTFTTTSKVLIGIAVLGTLIKMFVPSSKVIAAMYIVPQLVESKLVEKDLPEVYGMAVDFLKEKLKK